MVKKILIVSTVFILLAALIYLLLYNGFIRFNYPNEDLFPVRGIDISHHQKKIDWKRLKNEGATFVYMKATEGGSFKDTRFRENWALAEKSGFIKGAYHFFTFCKSGKRQAENFIESVPVEKSTLPPAIDLEFGGNCARRPTIREFTKELNDFIIKVRQKYGKEPLLYVTYSFYKRYMNDNIMPHKIWIRDIYKAPQLENNRYWHFWQYSGRGRLDGIDTFVDLNVFNGKREEFEKLLEVSFMP